MRRTIRFDIMVCVLIAAIFVPALPCLFFFMAILPHVSDIEEKGIVESTSRIGTAVDSLSANLVELGKVLSKNPSIIAASTEGRDTLDCDIEKLRIDWIVVLNSKGDVVFQYPKLQKTPALWPSSDCKIGVIIAGKTPILGCMLPIDSNQGRLVLGRKVTTASLGIKEDCRIDVLSAETTEGQKIVKTLGKANQIFLAEGDSNHVTESIIMNAFMNTGKMIIEAKFERTFKRAMKRQFFYLVALVAGVVSIAVIVMQYTLNQSMQGPLRMLATDISSVTRSADTTIDRKAYPAELWMIIGVLNGMIALWRSRDDERKDQSEIITSSIIPKLFAVRLWLEKSNKENEKAEIEVVTSLEQYINQCMQELTNMIEN